MEGNAQDSDLMVHFSVVAAVVAVAAILMRVFSSQVYDALIISMTRKWYCAVLTRLEEGSRVLDVGIGTATALVKNAQLVKEKKLELFGLDYEQNYISTAKRKVVEADLQDQVKVTCKSIFDEDLRVVLEKERGSSDFFDAAYFSGSWTLMPDPVGALRIAASFVKDDGKIYVTQTFQRQKTPVVGIVKPLLKYITTIDFGTLHYESHLNVYIEKAKEPVDGIGLEVEENGVVPGSIDNAYQAARLIIFNKSFSKK